MKTKIFILTLLTLTGITACTFVEDPVFSQSPAVRLANAIQETKDLLKSAENGWVMEYFPEETHQAGGYLIYMNFHSEKDTVTMACEMATQTTAGTTVPAYTPNKSLWKVTGEQSLLLSFDTYNPALHYWCDYGRKSGSFNRYSDFEFIVMQRHPDRIELKGRKWNARMIMHRMTGDGIEYLRASNALSSKINFNSFNMILNEADTIGRAEVSLGTNRRMFTFTYSNLGKRTEESIKKSFVYNPEGIRLYSPDSCLVYNRAQTDSTMIHFSEFKWDGTNAFVSSDPKLTLKRR
jgi:hypothetical protein